MGDDNWLHMEKLMSPETIDAVCNAFAELVRIQERPYSVVLHGGEPFLLGEKRLTDLLKKLRSVLPWEFPISIQSNGILITSQILDICSSYHTSVAVSIDGPRAVHNKHRIGFDGNGTFDKVVNGINELKGHPNADFLYAGILSVIDPLSDPSEIYHFFKSLGTPSVDFLYKDGNHTKLPLHKSSVESTEYGAWMSGLLNEYLSDEYPMPVRVLDDMLKVLMGGTVSKEGLGITDFGIIIIDTDGTVMKNDTLKSTFNGADKFTVPLNIKENSLLDFLQSKEFIDYRDMQRPSHQKCRLCPALHVCGGGMILHRWSKENGYDNPSIYCADQLLLIDSIQKSLAQYSINHEYQ